MEDSPVTPEEINSELTGLNKGDKFSKKQKILLSIGVGALFLILIVIIIILAATSGSSDSGSSSSDEEEEKKLVLGKISCIYNVQTTTQEIKLLGDNYSKESDFQIYIDGKLNRFTKSYTFTSRGSHEVIFNLNGKSINMDNMFYEVKDLISVNMTSENNCQILSMISTFEGCERLEDFNLEGFDGSQLKSMHKLFYKTILIDFSFNSFNTDNLEDISYMLSNTAINEFKLSGIKTSRVSNMSHLFSGCYNAQGINTSSIDTNNVIDMSYMFSSCGAINKLNLNEFITSNVIDMSHMFQNCFSLTNLEIDKLDTKKVEDMSFMFDVVFL